MWKEINDVLAVCANWFEAIGFIIAIFTAIKVYFLNKSIGKFNRKHLFRVRSEEHIVKLKEIASKMASYLSDFSENRMQLREQLKKSEEIIKSIKKKVSSSEAEELKNVIKEAKKIQKLPDSIDNLPKYKKWYYKLSNRDDFSEEITSQYYIKLTGLITYLEELKQDNENSLLP